MRQLIFGSPHQEFFTLADYSIQRELGRGGCGAVYLATAKPGGDPVAVKLMLSRANAEPRAIEQFKREMQVISGLQHANIVRFLDSGSDQGTFFFVMEYCDGGSLADVAKALGGTIPLDALMPWAMQSLEGLAAAHSKGFVHRDIKPHNILLHRNRAKISDFGLAKNFQKAGLSGMSMTGNYAGTPVFMPPEQITNFKYVKPVSDVWSFAASLYQLLTGKFPYQFDPKRDPIDVILNESPVLIRERMPGLEKKIATVIDKALLRNPKDRFADAGKLLAALPNPRS
jgi:serine/threonine protein kinase